MERFVNFPELETKRLYLRELSEKDIPVIFEMRKDPLVHSFIYRPLMEDAKQAEDILKKIRTNRENGTAIAWGAFHKTSEKLLATCGLNSISAENRRAEIGGEILPEFWGKNFAQEGFTAIIRYAFDVLKLHSIEARMISGNRSAIALVEKNGFVKEGHLHEYGYYNNEPFDLVIYTLFETGMTDRP